MMNGRKKAPIDGLRALSKRSASKRQKAQKKNWMPNSELSFLSLLSLFAAKCLFPGGWKGSVIVLRNSGGLVQQFR